MKISVIVPTYNRANILPLCLDSLVSQEYDKSSYEIIVVDNNSGDNTKEIVNNYITNYSEIDIRYIFEANAGLVFARHAGASNSKYEYLSFTDDDGILDCNWLKEIAHVFQLNTDIVAVAGKIKIRWDKEPPAWVIPYEPFLGKLDYGDDILVKEGLYINGGNFNIKKNILYDVGGFNPDQIGEWLIGDGESGLCRKLHEKNYLIGWAPNAIMEHYQIVEKNATVEDIKRRFINNGRGIPYRIFAIEKGGLKELLQNLLMADKQYQAWEEKLSISTKTEEIYKAEFEMAYYSCQIPYTYRILSDESLRNSIIKDSIKECEISPYFALDGKKQFKVLFDEIILLQKKYNTLKKETQTSTKQTNAIRRSLGKLKRFLLKLIKHMIPVRK